MWPARSVTSSASPRVLRARRPSSATSSAARKLSRSSSNARTLILKNIADKKQKREKKDAFQGMRPFCFMFRHRMPYFRLSATATATATVAPTMGLLPIEIRRFIRQKTTVLFCFCSTFERFLHLLFSFLFHFSLQSYYFFATVDTRLTNQHFSTALDKCNSKDILLLSLQFLVL